MDWLSRLRNDSPVSLLAVAYVTNIPQQHNALLSWDVISHELFLFCIVTNAALSCMVTTLIFSLWAERRIGKIARE